MNQNNKLIGYYQWGQKHQPNRLPFATYTYRRRSRPSSRLGQLGLQGRVERHAQRQAVSRSALRRLRLLLPARHQQPRQLLLARHRRAVSEGAHQRSSSIAIASSTTARDLLPRHRQGQPHASSSVASSAGDSRGKATRRAAAARATSSRSTPTASRAQVIFGIPTARSVEHAERAQRPASEAALEPASAVRQRHVAVGRSTVNLGVRYDRYKAGCRAGVARRDRRPRAGAAALRANRASTRWNLFAPRLG
jgi:hypothetical protein